MRLHLIAAIARNRVIGNDGSIPWDLPEDRRHFRTLTTGHAVLMGRGTWLSIGRPLPLRRNVILTHKPVAGMECHSTLERALEVLREERDVFVLGGGIVYAQTLLLADELNLTLLDRAVDGDTYFPEYEGLVGSVFREAKRDNREGFSFVDYVRI